MSDDYELTHPVYLDISMMMSFLAFLEGGVDSGGEETTTSGSTKEKKRELGAKLKLPSLFGFGAEGSGTGSSGNTIEQTLEYTAVRQHTSASLFNGLYSYLHEDNKVVLLSQEGELGRITPGQLVEMRGSYSGNPLEEVLNLFASLLAYAPDEGGQQPERQQQGRNRRRSGNPQVRNATGDDAGGSPNAAHLEQAAQEYGIRILQQMRQDMDASPVRDVLFQNGDGLKAVLTLDTRYFSEATREHLRAGEFIVLGKVTQLLEGDESINLARRTVLGAAGPELARQVILDSISSSAFAVTASDPIVTAPAVQILPMAIFV
ncbi:DUF6414 family protein [Streptomyces sp. NPDC003667]